MSELIVPVRVDALQVAVPTPVIGPVSDFTRLPWFDGRRDHNGQTPNIGSAINAEPFADHRDWLDPGVHLHWALPDGLTRGGTRRTAARSVRIDDLWFPRVPDRWLVRRWTIVPPPLPHPRRRRWASMRPPLPSLPSSDGGPTHAWLIQSDYVHPAGVRPAMPCAVFPRVRAQPHQPPFLYLGRQVALHPGTLEPLPDQVFAPMRAGDALAAQAPGLTALGHGDPYFAAQYTACRSVFGMWDNTPVEEGQSLVYDVVGWYSDPWQDPLGRLVRDVQRDDARMLSILAGAARKAGRAPTLTEAAQLDDAARGEALRHAVSDAFKWTIESESAAADFPDMTLCHGRTRLRVREDDATASVDPVIANPRPIGIGSSPAEAFAALIRGAPPRGGPEEDSLVQSLAATDLSAHPHDLGLKLREARHNEQFRAHRGHSIWALRPSEEADAEGAGDAHDLSPALAGALNRLNILQESYDTARDEIDTLRQALYADWTHAMRAAYPEGDEEPFAVDPALLFDHIERTRLGPLEALLDHAGELFPGEKPSGDLHLTDDLFQGAAGPVAFGPVIGAEEGHSRVDFAGPQVRFRGLRIRAGAIIDAVQVLTRPGRGTLIGGRGGDPTEILMADGEYITAISGAQGSWAGMEVIKQLSVETSFGRVLGPFGFLSGTPFRLEAPEGTAIVGLRGFADRYLHAIGILVGPLKGLTAGPLPPSGSLARAVLEQRRTVEAMLREDAARRGAAPLVLGMVPGPRYWQPHDPVVALTEPGARPGPRHGHNTQQEAGGPETCKIITLSEGWTVADGPLGERERRPLGIDDIAPLTTTILPQETDSTGVNWHPLHLEWQVEFQPLVEGANIEDPDYDPAFITRHHDLPDDGVELKRRGRSRLVETYDYIAGRATLTPSMGILLRERYEALGGDAAVETPVILPLGGFHERLMMRRVEPMIRIADPIGVPAQRSLARRVRRALDRYFPVSPVPAAPFHPLRAGEVLFQRLRLVDTFGRTREWRPDTVHKTHRMRAKGAADDRARLPARFSQPVRLNFRWLSGGHDDEVESNAHPATSPVTGWLVPNELDGTVEIHDGAGLLLGVVDDRAIWRPAPGDPLAPRSPLDIPDRGVRRVVQWLCRPGDDDRIGHFVGMLDQAMQRIDPLDAARPQARAMLVGRPLAITRARLGLRPLGGLVEEQSLAALRLRMTGAITRATHGYEHVEVPVRLGEHGALNDGLCGYWIEEGGGFRGNLYHTPHGLMSDRAHADIRVLSDELLRDFPLRLTLSSAPVTVTMLMDPRGSVHATTGVLPTKSLMIPRDQYADQIEALRLVFDCGPVVMPAGHIAVPLPSEPGFSWSWIDRSGDAWRSVPHHPMVERAAVITGFGGAGAALWDRLVDTGRIRLDDRDDRGLLMPVADIDVGDLGLTPAQVERGLHALALGIDDADTHAMPAGRAVARDGWLQLQAVPKHRPPPRTPEDEALS